MSSESIDNYLLNESDILFREAQFSTQRGTIYGANAPCLLAENQFFVVVVIASRTLDAVRRLESFASADLLERIRSASSGAKRWDAYLVMLTEEKPADSETESQLVDLQYNTRGVRRLVSTGVTDRAALEQALRLFLPLPSPVPGGLSDALTDLADQLVLNGLGRSEAERYVAAFADRGDLDDI